MAAEVPAPTPLSTALRRATARAHASSERSPFLSAVVAGTVSRDGVVALLQRLAVVSTALEDAGRRLAGHPALAPFRLRALERAERVHEDLRRLGARPDDGSPAARAFADRLAGADAPRWLAHHCVRSLADLSGGQVMAAGLARVPGLPPLGFLSFPDLDVPAARTRYRALLDAAPLSAREREQVCAEALVAYRLHDDLYAELTCLSSQADGAGVVGSSTTWGVGMTSSTATR